MALIKCCECGKEISDKSELCPNCGCPTIESIKKIKINKQLTENHDNVFYKCPVCNKQYENGTLSCDLCGYEIIPSSYQNSTSKQPSNQVHCPYCNSTNVNKISSTKKTISIIGFGILSNKIGKQWHCNNCKSDF